MARGKDTCRILKEIRRQIAAANDIEFTTSECRYKGDCLGTCPKCEAEVRYLEEQLRARSLAGKRVMLVGMSAGMLLMSGCNSNVNVNADSVYYGLTPGEVVVYTDYELDSVLVQPGEVTVYRKTNLDSILVEPGLIPDPIQENDSLDGTAIGRHDTEISPEFPGGEDALVQWICENLKYPKEALAWGISGTVNVEFTVDWDGSIQYITVDPANPPSLNEEVIRLLKSMPEWTPGRYNNTPMVAGCTLKIKFQIPEL